MCDDRTFFYFSRIELDEVLDHFMTTLSIVASSSSNTPRDTTVFLMTFPDPPFPLVWSTKFAVGETFDISPSVDEDDTCCEC